MPCLSFSRLIFMVKPAQPTFLIIARIIGIRRMILFATRTDVGNNHCKQFSVCREVVGLCVIRTIYSGLYSSNFAVSLTINQAPKTDFMIRFAWFSFRSLEHSSQVVNSARSLFISSGESSFTLPLIVHLTLPSILP